MMSDNDMQAVIEAAREGVPFQVIEETPANLTILVPGHADIASQVHVLNRETGLLAPLRKRGSVVVFDAASFNQVLADNADAGNIAIYFDRNPDKPSVVAVMNGNGKAGAGWSDFRCRIEFRQTPQWIKWKKLDGQMLPQVAFAEFIEDNIEDIADPAGATMLEIATYLEAVRTVNFKSGVRLTSGAIQLRHEQDDQAKVGASTLDVPETFKLGISPIFGLPSYSVPARFRYRILDGKLTLGFKLQRVETMMVQIVEDVIAKIERGANVSVMDGLPPDPPR